MQKWVKTFYDFKELPEKVQETAKEKYLERNYDFICRCLEMDLEDIAHNPKDHGLVLSDSGYKVLEFFNNTEAGITYDFDDTGIRLFKAMLTPYEIECLLTLCVKELKLDTPATFETNVREIIEDTYYENEMDAIRLFEGLVPKDHRYYKNLLLINELVTQSLTKLKQFLSKYVIDAFSDSSIQCRLEFDQEANCMMFDADGNFHFLENEGYTYLE